VLFGEGEMMRNRRRWIVPRVLLLPFVCIVLLDEWSKAWAEEKPTLAIIPFFAEEIADPSRGAVCPVCGGAYRRGNLPLGTRDTLTRLLHQKMDPSNVFRVTPAEKVEEALSHVEKATLEDKPTQASLQIGKELDANFVMVGFVFRFDERVGSPMGVEKPASVGFDLHLLRLRDGRVIWTGKFDETQQPLSEDMRKIGSFLRRGGVWVTAKELASDGMSQMLKDLPDPSELEK
jgi:hypothetical protein